MASLPPPADLELAELMARLEDPAFFACLPGAGARAGVTADAEPEREKDADATAALAREGWLALERAVEGADAARLVASIDALGQQGLPPLFVYAHDATWAIGVRVAERLSRALGVRYALLPDAWAFRIAPGPEHGGWSPHRGSYELLPDRAAPALLNVWVALTDATLDNACMHLVPLDDDPAYPAELRSHAASSRARPVPAAAGTALAWNANVLHSGGRSTARAKTPRVSITFTLRAAPAAEAHASPRSGAHPPLLDLAKLDHRVRLDLLADQVLLYGDLDASLPDVVGRWARLNVGLRNLMRFEALGRPT